MEEIYQSRANSVEIEKCIPYKIYKYIQAGERNQGTVVYMDR